jgi:hypothetical protein
MRRLKLRLVVAALLLAGGALVAGSLPTRAAAEDEEGRRCYQWFDGCYCSWIQSCNSPTAKCFAPDGLPCGFQ